MFYVPPYQIENANPIEMLNTIFDTCLRLRNAGVIFIVPMTSGIKEGDIFSRGFFLYYASTT